MNEESRYSKELTQNYKDLSKFIEKSDRIDRYTYQFKLDQIWEELISLETELMYEIAGEDI